MQNILSVRLVFIMGICIALTWKHVYAQGESEETETILEVEPPEYLINSGVSNNLERQEQHVSATTIHEALFSCLEVHENSPPHRPRTLVIWMKDGVILDLNSKKYKNYGQKKRLLIRELNEQDSGIYECAFSRNSTNKGKAELWFTPVVHETPTPQELEVQTSVVVFCNVSWSTRRVEWLKNGSLIASTDENLNQDSRYFVHTNGSLLISIVVPSDRGLYRCVASNSAGQASAEIEVTINMTDLLTLPPSINSGYAKPIEEMDRPINDTNIEKTCVDYEDVSFSPAPILQFTPKVPELDQPHPSPLFGAPDQVEWIPPYFTKIPPSCIQTIVGYTIVLPCSASGSPTPTITWTHSDKELDIVKMHSDNSVRHSYIQLPDGSLQITTVQADDKGVFTCLMSSESGSNSTSVQLRVREVETICGMGGGSQRSDVDHMQRKRVVLGEQVTAIEDWPWQVLLEYNLTSQGQGLAGSGSQEYNEQLCGGALIRPDWLLTAAHCLFSGSYQRRDPSDLIVRIGVFNRSDYSEPHQQLLKVFDYIVHPQYIPIASGSEHDVALIKLTHPVRPSSNTGYICLPSRAEEPPEGTLCTITGWGHLEHEAGVSPELLHKAEVPLVSLSRCRSPQSYGSAVTRNMLCAGWRDGGPDACQNDSGGPLVCASNGRWAIYGVVNYGDGCGFPHKYGVYARVTKYVKWINKTMTEFV